MKLYIDKNDVIIDVGATDDASLMEVTIDDENIKGWSEAKICCHAVYRDGTKVTGLYPVVSTKLIRRIDKLGKQAEAVKAQNTDTNSTVDDIMTDILPSLAEEDASINATLDSILTDIIPSLMGE